MATSTVYNPATAVLSFSDFVEPFSSSTNDRYISNSTSTGSVSEQVFYNQFIYTRATSDWTTTTPTDSMSVFNRASSTFEVFSTTGIADWTPDNSNPDRTGLANDSKLDLFWNNRFNATSTWSGNLLIGGSATVTGNFWVAGNTTTTGSLSIGTELCFAGANCSSWLNPIYASDTSVATSTGATPAELVRETITGGDMGANGKLEIEFSGQANSTSGTLTGHYGVYFGDELITTSSRVVLSGTVITSHVGQVSIWNRGSESSQWVSFTFITDLSLSDMPEGIVTTTAMSIDTSTDQDIMILGITDGANGRMGVQVFDVKLTK